MENKENKIIVISNDFFLGFFREFKSPCGYIKTKNKRPVYGRTKLTRAHKRPMRTREGFRK